jgi:protein-L-isoaspartate(D-aspartate) O-methyltransferase
LKIKDSHRQQGKRKQLVETVRAKGITSEKVLEALNKVPRHLFMDSGFEDHAYQDKAFPIAAGQTISQPYTVAYQTELLDVQKGDKILEVGTGSGYQTAILCELGAKVHGIERQNELYKKTKKFLDEIGYRPKHLAFGDGYKGMPDYAPFDGILVTAGASEVPKALLKQLKIGGKMVIPIGGPEFQTMTLFVKKSAREIGKKELGQFRFVPLLKDKN